MKFVDPQLEAMMLQLQDSKNDQYQRMILMLKLYRPRPSVVDAITAAYNATDWDWYESDGCTGVDEMYSPLGMKFPPCVMHDHWCWKADQAKTLAEARVMRAEGDSLFFAANIDFRVPIFILPLLGFRNSVIGRWLGVRLWWLCFAMHFWKEPTTEGK